MAKFAVNGFFQFASRLTIRLYMSWCVNPRNLFKERSSWIPMLLLPRLIRLTNRFVTT